MFVSNTPVIVCATRLLALAAASLVACSLIACDATCPKGYEQRDGRCVTSPSSNEDDRAIEGSDGGAPRRRQTSRVEADGGPSTPRSESNDPPACSGAGCGGRSGAPVGGRTSVAGTGGTTPAGNGGTSCKGKLCGGKCGECCTQDDCPEKTGLVASCDPAALSCEYTCPDDKRDCHGKCIASDECCADADCPMQSGKVGRCDTATRQCDWQTAACQSGLKRCGERCVSQASCCSDNECDGMHACVNDSCSSSQCIGGHRACGNGSCVTVTGGCCSDDECEGKACVEGRCSAGCRADYVTCGNGGCVPMQGACVAVVFLVPPTEDCAASLCTPERETCKNNKFRRVLRSSTDPAVLKTMCASTFESMRQSICAEPDVAGKSEIVVNYYVDLYNPDGSWMGNFSEGSGTCAN